MKLDKYYKVLQETPKDLFEDTRLSMQILERIHELLEEKFGGKQKLLADKMGKSEAEISKLLSGIQNYTTRTLVKFELAFGAPIIAVCTSEDNSTFVNVKVCPLISHSTIHVRSKGQLEEKITEYENFDPSKKITGGTVKNLPI